MDVNFWGQPWRDGMNLDDFLADAANQNGPLRLRMAVAWAKRSGLERIRPHLDAWRQGGGTVSMVIGVSAGGATRQGLEQALQIADSVHLFHDESGRTFHPKVYVAEAVEATSLFTGSNNMTAGGVYANYEAALVVKVPASEVATSAVIKQFDDWFSRLLHDEQCSRELTAATLPAFLNQGKLRIGDEDERPSAGAGGDAGAEAESGSLFGKSSSPKKKARHDPPATMRGAGSWGAGPDAPLATAGEPVPPKPPATTGSGETDGPTTASSEGVTGALATMRWSKRLKGTDAQQPPGVNTQPTYNVRLSAARHPIDITTYFRDDFFDTTSWQLDPIDTNIEYTLVKMTVNVHGEVHGIFEFRVDHDLDRVSSQGNVPTVLKWGPMVDYMRKHNHVDDWLLLEKLDDGTFVLSIEAADPGTS